MEGQIIGNWRLEHHIGGGGMGEVYFARNKNAPSLEAAVKLLHHHLARDDKFRMRFQREVKAQSCLDHPHIVKIRDFGGMPNGGLYLVTDLLKGGTLEQRLELLHGEPLPLHQALYWIFQLLDGLSAAHLAGVIHRDIKPANLLLDSEDNLRIGDFGLAMLVEESHQSTTLIGTPAYMSPEQLERPNDVGPRSDIYAVGILLYRMLCGRMPFDYPWAKLTQMPPAPSQIRSDFPEWLEPLIMRAISRDPEARFVSARDFLNELEEGGFSSPLGKKAKGANKRKSGKKKESDETESVPVPVHSDQAATKLPIHAGADALAESVRTIQIKTQEPKPGMLREIELNAQVVLRLRWIPAGKFIMGSPEEERGHYSNEIQHEVTLSKGFWLGETAITQAQWRILVPKNPSGFKGDMLPVENITWLDAESFCKALNRKHFAHSGALFRLPTEAEWEYACRAGSKTPFYFGERLDTNMANFDGNYPYGQAVLGEYREKTVPVGSFPANDWGLCDMHGNVWEWCSNWYAAYPVHPVTDPKGPDQGDMRVLRGGSWFSSGQNCRSANRRRGEPLFQSLSLGFRVLLQ